MAANFMKPLFAVGTRVTSRPPHRSVRAQFGHTFFVNVCAHHFVAPLFVDSFVRPAPRAFFRPDRILAVAVARSEGQGRRFFSAAEGLSLTNASTAANCP